MRKTCQATQGNKKMQIVSLVSNVSWLFLKCASHPLTYFLSKLVNRLIRCNICDSGELSNVNYNCNISSMAGHTVEWSWKVTWRKISRWTFWTNAAVLNIGKKSSDDNRPLGEGCVGSLGSYLLQSFEELYENVKQAPRVDRCIYTLYNSILNPTSVAIQRWDEANGMSMSCILQSKECFVDSFVVSFFAQCIALAFMDLVWVFLFAL